ncbi:MAG: helix-turn-helix transcriptional regulator [Kiritimatiellae bacterium]|nr:helix-turn-helix transcriptional regulator [Kiritimatiellia bacterium]
MNLALDFISLHATSGATAADAVKAAGCSPSLLQRYFKKALGRTVIQEIQRVRLEKACRLLRHSETPISEIGPLCGYEDEIYFKLLFRRAYGKSMRDYRREARR